MTQKDKELLLKDICARLPFGVRVKSSRRRMPVTLSLDVMTDFRLGCSIKPYLRSMDSMTEEEEKEFHNQIYKAKPHSDGRTYNVYEVTGLNIDWLNAHHFDYRGLIEKDLAIEVTKENNPYERK